MLVKTVFILKPVGGRRPLQILVMEGDKHTNKQTVIAMSRKYLERGLKNTEVFSTTIVLCANSNLGTEIK